MSALPTAPRGVASPVDEQLLEIYLSDHLAGAVAGSHRIGRLARTLRGTRVGPTISRVAAEVSDEREELRRLIGTLGLAGSPLKQAVARAGEVAARLKANGRIVRSSPLTALLETEIARSAVAGKLGLWQTLDGLGEASGMAPGRSARLVDQTAAQLEALTEVHAYVRARALRAGAARA
ncbi:hypothetical protein [Actinotalea subterranea]|uniref:hypothetical protein n=1 Tax=Actinotalea subterranea TaxID=2607497 RepID=UPI0011ECF489|nr:hypothetical protein [Actinotalea subterranea]